MLVASAPLAVGWFLPANSEECCWTCYVPYADPAPCKIYLGKVDSAHTDEVSTCIGKSLQNNHAGVMYADKC